MHLATCVASRNPKVSHAPLPGQPLSLWVCGKNKGNGPGQHEIRRFHLRLQLIDGTVPAAST
jgi:hypothetical protein